MRYSKPARREISDYVAADYLLDLIRDEKPLSTEEAAKQAAARIIKAVKKSRIKTDQNA